MSALADLTDDRADALRALTARLKHDLGKYIAFGARWLPDDAPLAERRDALRSDLVGTRRGPDGVQDALAVWEPYALALTGQAPLPDGPALDLSDDPDVVRLIADMAALAELVPALRDDPDSVGAVAVDDGLTLTRRVSRSCRDLHRRVLEAFPDHG